MNTQTSTSIHLHEQEARWFAIYTRYKREKLIRQRLEEKGITTYLPIQKLVRHYTRKVKVVDLPLISCYVFVKITKKDYVSVLKTPDVLHFVKCAGQLTAIPEDEIQLLRRVVGEVNEIEVDKCSYEHGDEVEIIGGNLTGIKGILIDPQNKNNFLIELNQIGYSLRMQVDASQLKRVSSGKNASTNGAKKRLPERSAS